MSTTAKGCPACGASASTFMFFARDWVHGVPGEFRLVRCDRCASLYPDPRPSADLLAMAYPEDYYSYVDPVRYRLFGRRGLLARIWYSTVRGVLRRRYGYSNLGGSSVLAATLGRLPMLRTRATFGLGVRLHPWRRGGALLDVGCGAGMYLDLLRALGWSRVVGVDIGENAVRKARELLGIEAYAGELEHIELPTATFDAVTISHTLEHVPDPRALLAEVRRVTRPGGRVAIVVPNASSLLARLLREHWMGLETPRHLTNFTPRGLRLVVKRADLEVETWFTSARTAYLSGEVGLARAHGEAGSGERDGLDGRAPGRRLHVAALAGLEHALCAARIPVGEEICMVARA